MDEDEWTAEGAQADDVYEVERVTKSRVRDGETEYLTVWAGWPGQDSWEPASFFDNEASWAVGAFKTEQKDKLKRQKQKEQQQKIRDQQLLAQQEQQERQLLAAKAKANEAKEAKAQQSGAGAPVAGTRRLSIEGNSLFAAVMGGGGGGGGGGGVPTMQLDGARWAPQLRTALDAIRAANALSADADIEVVQSCCTQAQAVMGPYEAM